MTGEPETLAALRRAAVRVAYHLLRAGVESLKAIEAVVEELGSVASARRSPPADERPIRIEVE